MGLLDGKIAILTGGGRGIGAATAKLLASEGATVVVSDLDQGPANKKKSHAGETILHAPEETPPLGLVFFYFQNENI